MLSYNFESMIDFKHLALANRSYRRFDQSYPITRETLVDLVGLARLAASGRNAQPLKYFLCAETVLNEEIFQTLAWAGYLKDWPGPVEGERPSGYIIVLLDHRIADHCFCDDGIAMQNILLGAVEKGLGGCILRAFNRPKLSTLLHLPDHLEILDVIALGKPIEQVVVTQVGPDGDIKYYRDSQDTHFVPKRSIDELVFDPFVK